MELEFAGGAVIPIAGGTEDSVTEIGRTIGSPEGPYSSDRTVSRRHLSLRLAGDGQSRVCFEVIGMNPIWIYPRNGRDKSLFRNSEKGELSIGDRFSLSLKNPIFIGIRTRAGGGGREKEEEDVVASGAIDGLELEFGSLDVSRIDAAKEFGFLVKGHEFDCYPKKKIRAFKEWNFFLKEQKRDDTDDEKDEDFAAKRKESGRRKRGKAKGDDGNDEEWTWESEDEKEMVTKSGTRKRLRYSTRSKDQNKSHGNALDDRNKSHKVVAVEDKEEDETLGGFIVDDEQEDMVTEGEEEEEEEEDDDEEEYYDD